jgi:hypothetical protein
VDLTHRLKLGLKPAQKQIFYSHKRHKVVVAGRRFGKTFLALIWLITQASRYARSKNWYVCPTRPMAKDIAWEDLKFILSIGDDGTSKNPLVREVSETELFVRLSNNAVIALKGASEPDKLRGRGLKSVVMDEFADMDPGAWVVIRPQLSDKRLRLEYGELGQTLFIGTPKGYNHFKDLFDAARTGAMGPDWGTWRFTSLEGGNIDATEIRSARSDLTDRDFRQEYMATFESIEGRVYHAFLRDWYKMAATFNRGNLDAGVRDLGQKSVILVGMDFNVNPMSATLSTKVHVERPWGWQYEMHTWKEYSVPNCNTSGMMQAIRADYPGRHLVVFPDPTGRARSTTSGNVGETDHTIIQSFGADLYIPKFNTNSDKYNTVNGLLCNSLGIRRKVINPETCPILVKSYDGLCYKKGTNLADKTHGLDHMTDADAYAIIGAFPIHTAVVEFSTVSM